MSDLQQELRQFTGTETWYKNPLYPWMLYTDGVQHFAENAGAYWFLDSIGTELRELTQKEVFIHVALTVANGAAVISADDGNDNPLYLKEIEFTDCPEGTWEFYLTDNVLLLPSEY